jgi:mono/diheme cytochrome c family protein
MEAAQNNCLSCHSADYVSTQPPQLGQKFWETEVSKMVKAYHASISETDVKAIVEYLSRTY